MNNNDTICAIASAHGKGAIAIIRISGENAISITDKIFESANKSKILANQATSTTHFGYIKDAGNIVDEVIVSIYRKPHSYTGENSIEISCHASSYIQQKILQLLIESGARLASPGEFTQRAFLNGKMDLSQAEAVADVIASSNLASHKIAINQMRGGFSHEINSLRQELLNFISLIELELDFSEEDVEFADRSELSKLIAKIDTHISKLENSFKLGNAIKNGIPVAIIGKPNVGKSTLLNVLLNDDKAIVSEIEGTTRDTIEDVVNIGGFNFRFIDTAGLRKTTDTIETIGIERTLLKVEKSEIVLYLFDKEDISSVSGDSDYEFESIISKYPNKKYIAVVNKIDKSEAPNYVKQTKIYNDIDTVYISAKDMINIENLTNILIKSVDYDASSDNDIIVSNIRHYQALSKASEAIARVKQGLINNITSDFIAQDIREVLHYLGEITGEINTDDILGNIFKNFCIGK